MSRSVSRNRGSDEQQIDLTPMLDVVFIMLIFFIVTATFIKLPGVDVVRPGAAVPQSLKPSMLVAIDGESRIWVDRDIIDPKFLRTTIAALFSDNPQGALVIQADEESRVEQIALVADAAKEAGIVVVQISAEGD